MDELLRLENINFCYEERSPVLKDISASIFRGQRIAVLGGNGAGKSTFFLCCNGVLKPQSGSIFLKGKKLAGDKKSMTLLRQTIGLVFQEPDSQIIAGTVENEISFGPMNLGLQRSQVESRVDAAIKQMRLEEYRKRAPQYMSGGEKKRLSIADILAMQSEMILLDEPTASLDPENVQSLENTLDELSSMGITIVASTHDVDFAYRFAERAMVFAKGRIIADADIDKVLASDTVMAEAGLKKPLLYQVSQMLGKCCGEDLPNKSPRTIKQMEEYIRERWRFIK